MRRSGEGLVLMLSVALLLGVFGYAIWASRPRVKTWTATVFDSHTDGRATLVLSYGSGRKTFQGTYNFTAGGTYKITYLRGIMSNRILEAEEIGGG